MDLSLFLQQSINAISLGAIYALFALGYALVFSILGVLNLAHSAIFMWGAFIGLLALDPEKAPILMTIIVLGTPLTILSMIFEYRVMQPFAFRIPHAAWKPTGLLVARIVIYGFVVWVGTLVYAPLRALFSETLMLHPLLGFVLAMIGSGLISIALEFVAFRPLRERGAERLAQLISSIGAALVLVNLAQFAFQAVYGRTEAYYPREVSLFRGIPLLDQIPTEPILFGDVRVVPLRILILVIALGLMLFLRYLVLNTRIGQQMRAVSFSERIASLLGIDVSRIYIMTFFFAGAFGGAAGMLFGVAFLNVTPFIGDSIALVGLTAIVLGGLGSVPGALVGGFIVAGIQTFSVALGGSSYRDAIVFILLFVVLLIRPQGLFGEPEQKRA